MPYDETHTQTNLAHLWKNYESESKAICRFEGFSSISRVPCVTCENSAIVLPFHVWYGDGNLGLAEQSFKVCLNCNTVLGSPDVLKSHAAKSIHLNDVVRTATPTFAFQKINSASNDGRIVNILADFNLISISSYSIIRNCDALLDVPSGTIDLTPKGKQQIMNSLRWCNAGSHIEATEIQLSFQYGAGEHPRIAKIEPTQHCNLKCTFCSNPMLKERSSLSYIDFLKVWEKFDPNKLIKVGFTGLGESVLNKDFWKMHDRVKRHSIYTSLVTNGMLLPRFKERFYDSGLNDLAISIESLDSETFESARRGAKLVTIIDGIIDFLSGARSKPSAPHIHIICAIDFNKIKEIRPIAEFCAENQLGAPKIYPLYNRFSPNFSHGEFRLQDFEEIRIEFSHIFDTVPRYLCREHFLLSEKSTKGLPYSRMMCQEPWSVIVARADGGFSRCNESIFEMESGVASSEVFDTSAGAVWNSEYYTKLRMGFWYKIPPNACRQCNAHTLIEDAVQ